MAKADTITVTWGAEDFHPVKYNGFIVGPFTYSTTVQDGETPEQAFKRASDVLKAMAEKAFLAKQRGFVERLRATQQI